MKNSKNKFIIIVVIFIFIIVGYVNIDIFFKSGIDRSSYIILLNGEANLNNNILELEKKAKLHIGDEIETIGNTSLAVIKWGDGSITRMGGNSTVIIKESKIDEDLHNINISFDLEKGKTWSNVISFIGNKSYFHQEFADTTAAVRGTIFEVNLDKDYLYVDAHELKLTRDDGDVLIISEKYPFIVSEFSFTSLIEFIKEFQDSPFRKLNVGLDEEFYENLVNNIGDINEFTTEKIYDISNLALEKKEELYNKTLSDYQKLNFINVEDVENYRKKLELKELLIDLSNPEDKQNLLITTLYDFKDLTKNKQFEELKELTYILSDNVDSLNTLDIKIENYIDLNKIDNLKIPEGLKKEFENNFNNIKDSLNLDDNALFDSAKKSLDNIKNLDEIKDSLNLDNNSLLDSAKKSLDNVKNLDEIKDSLDLDNNALLDSAKKSLDDVKGNLNSIGNNLLK